MVIVNNLYTPRGNLPTGESFQTIWYITQNFGPKAYFGWNLWAWSIAETQGGILGKVGLNFGRNQIFQEQDLQVQDRHRSEQHCGNEMKAAKSQGGKHERCNCNTSPAGPLCVRPRCLKQGMAHRTRERSCWPDVPVFQASSALDTCSQGARHWMRFSMMFPTAQPCDSGGCHPSASVLPTS